MNDRNDRSRGRSAGSAAVSIASAADEEAVVGTILLAFAGDPAARWTWPNARDYMTHMPHLIRAFEHGSAYGAAAFAGAALWLPPDVGADEEALGALIQHTTAAEVRDDCLAVIEQMGKFHPEGPHWYLPLIGVDPARQGRGLGDALMTYALQRCDRDRVPAYLESSNPRNIPFYRRHGFDEIGAIQAGSSPTIVPMLRSPR